MSDNIEIPEVDTDEIVETSDEETSVASNIAIAAAGVTAGLGIGYCILKLSNKIGDKMYDHIVAQHERNKTTEDLTEPDQKE
jgi:hypothetical protein